MIQIIFVVERALHQNMVIYLARDVFLLVLQWVTLSARILLNGYVSLRVWGPAVWPILCPVSVEMFAKTIQYHSSSPNSPQRDASRSVLTALMPKTRPTSA
jgi:hypothetical protein